MFLPLCLRFLCFGLATTKSSKRIGCIAMAHHKINSRCILVSCPWILRSDVCRKDERRRDEDDAK